MRSCGTYPYARCAPNGGNSACSALTVPQNGVGGEAGRDDDLIGEQAPALTGAGDDACCTSA